MKVKIRKTGEVVDVITYSGHTYRSDIDVVSYIDSKGNECVDMKMNRFWDFEDVEESYLSAKESLIDWEERRFELIKAAMQGFCSNTSEQIMSADSNATAEWSIGFADALIKKLREYN